MSHSLSSRALDALLEEGGEAAEALKDQGTSGIHRTLLHRYRKGTGKPDAQTIARLERLTGGRVPANGWEDEEEAPKSTRKTRAARKLKRKRGAA